MFKLEAVLAIIRWLHHVEWLVLLKDLNILPRGWRLVSGKTTDKAEKPKEANTPQA